ncbi:MAG: hypothetical protein V4710_24315, partial [Verrucomicrobiota bacterium]
MGSEIARTRLLFLEKAVSLASYGLKNARDFWFREFDSEYDSHRRNRRMNLPGVVRGIQEE